MLQEDYWNQASEKKEFTTPFQLEVFGNYVSKEQTILDVGCGYGRTLNELRQAGWGHLIGMDFAGGMIQRGHKLFPFLDLRVMKNGQLALPDNSVDAVILFAVLTCLRSNEEQKHLIGEIRRVLKPGGTLYVNDFLLNRDSRNLERYRTGAEKYGIYGVFDLPEGAICRHHEEAWLKELLSGFAHLKWDHLTFTTMNGHQSNGFYMIGANRKP